EGPSDGAFVTISGLITSLERRVAKTSGNPYARAEVEDLGASIDVMFFGRVYEPISSVIAEDLIVSIKGRVQRRDDGSVVISAQEITIIDARDESADGALHLTNPSFKATEPFNRQLGYVLRSHSDTTNGNIKLVGNLSMEIQRIGPQYKVDPNPALF